MRRLLLLRHASTTAVHRAAFPVDEALDSAGLRAATALAGRLGAGEALCAPALRARATAAAAGLDADVDSALAECDFGAWAGRTLADVHAADPAAAEAWMTDPDAAPHGGESLTAFLARVGAWLDAQAALDGRAIAITHGGVVKAAVAHALGAPPAAFWRIDVAPLHVTEMHAHDRRWTVTRVNAAVAAGEPGERGRVDAATGAAAAAGEAAASERGGGGGRVDAGAGDAATGAAAAAGEAVRA
jgi:broad specificity phosphatase PhoE